MREQYFSASALYNGSMIADFGQRNRSHSFKGNMRMIRQNLEREKKEDKKMIIVVGFYYTREKSIFWHCQFSCIYFFE